MYIMNFTHCLYICFTFSVALNGLSSVELECLLNYIYCTSPKNEEEAVMIVPLLKPFGIVSWLDDIVKKKERSSG